MGWVIGMVLQIAGVVGTSWWVGLSSRNGWFQKVNILGLDYGTLELFDP
jgi:hypothetical protein